MTRINVTTLLLGIAVVIVEESSKTSVLSLSLNKDNNVWDRRTALTNFAKFPVAIVAGSSFLPAPVFAAAGTSTSDAEVTSVVIDDSESATLVGIQFEDVILDGSNKESVVVKSVQPGSIAESVGVKEGMILLGKDSATKASKGNVEFRMRNGPYPFILQFTSSKEFALASDTAYSQQIDETGIDIDGTRLLQPNDRMMSKVIQKPTDCTIKAKNGDIVEIKYEARITSKNGPIYDSTAWRNNKSVKFTLGKGYAISGVDIGVNNMCVGEIKELDIPTGLGYGKFGSQVFDIPGDKRLWWRVELLGVEKSTESQNPWKNREVRNKVI